MNDTFHFGGGAFHSNMHPAVIALVIAACAGVILLPRKYALCPVMIVAFLTPWGEELLVAGVHLYAMRIVIIACCVRLLRVKASGQRLLRSGLSPIDKVFFLWAFFRGLTFILLFKSNGATINQFAFWLDTYGAYGFFRYCIRDKDDLTRTFTLMAWIAVVLAPCMLYESFTRVDLFSYLSKTPIIPWIRGDKFRAQGPFTENSITAGTFGAVLFPLFFWLWKSRRAKATGIAGSIASTVIVVTSVASTAAMAYFGAIIAIFLWPLRNHMRKIRWGLVSVVIGLSLVMKAPVWYLIARVDFVGGHGWDRAYLIDVTVRHFSNWWLLGTRDNASWGVATWDACNQFVEEALSGGLISLVLFVTLITRGFSLIGRARMRVEGKYESEWLFWCLGAALFTHVMAFTGVDYMDMTQDWWFVSLAIISAATIPIWAKATTETTVSKNLRMWKAPNLQRPVVATPAAMPSSALHKPLRPWGGPEL